MNLMIQPNQICLIVKLYNNRPELLPDSNAEKYVSKIYKSGQPHQNVNNLIINTCRFCINRDKWGGYKDEKFQQFTISPLKNA